MGVEAKDGSPLGSIVCPKTLEQRAPVMDDVGSNMDFSLRPGNKLTIHPDFSILIKRTHEGFLFLECIENEKILREITPFSC